MFGSGQHPKALRQFCDEMRQRAWMSFMTLEADNAVQGRRVFFNLFRKPAAFETETVSRDDQLLSFAVCAIHQQNIEVWRRSEIQIVNV